MKEWVERAVGRGGGVVGRRGRAIGSGQEAGEVVQGIVCGSMADVGLRR